MQGRILDYNRDTSQGIISANDGNRYEFTLAHWMSSNIQPTSGLEVDFILNDMTPTKIYALEAPTKNQTGEHVTSNNLQSPPTSSAAIASLVFAIIGFATDWWTFAIPSIIAIIFGHIARTNIKNSEGTLVGDGLAIGGLVLGYLILILYLFTALFIAGALGLLLSHNQF